MQATDQKGCTLSYSPAKCIFVELTERNDAERDDRLKRSNKPWTEFQVNHLLGRAMAIDIRSAVIGFAASPVALFVLKKLFEAFRDSVYPDTSSRGLKVIYIAVEVVLIRKIV